MSGGGKRVMRLRAVWIVCGAYDSSVMECEGCVRGVGVRGVREGSGERSTCGEWVRGVREGSG